jgi:hypothetical protein
MAGNFVIPSLEASPDLLSWFVSSAVVVNVKAAASRLFLNIGEAEQTCPFVSKWTCEGRRAAGRDQPPPLHPLAGQNGHAEGYERATLAT